MARRIEAALISVACSVFGCRRFIEFDAPIPDGTRTIAIAIEGERGLEISVARREEISLPSTALSDAKLTMLAYLRDIDSLRLTPGVQEAASDPTRARAMPMFDAAFSADIEDGSAGDWRPLAEVSAALQLFRIPELSFNECAARGGCFSARAIDLTGERNCDLACASPPDVSRPSPPDPPMPPALPVLTPCVAGWQEIERAGIRVCDPPSFQRFHLACAPGEIMFFDGCAPLGHPCPAGEWPDIDPSERAVYARAGASGGDGSAAQPFSLSQAIATASPDTVIAVGRGTHEIATPLVIGAERTLRGACMASTTIRGTATSTRVLVVAGNDVIIEDLSIAGGSRALSGGASASSLRVRSVSIAGASVEGISLSLGATATISDAVISSAPRGIGVRFAARASLRHVRIENTNIAAITAMARSTAHSFLRIRSLLIEGNDAATTNGILATRADLDLAHVAIEHVSPPALGVDTLTATIADVAMAGVIGTEPAVAFTNARARVGGIAVRDAERYGIALSSGTVATLEDVFIGRVYPFSEDRESDGFEIGEGAAVDIARARVEDAARGAHVYGTATVADALFFGATETIAVVFDVHGGADLVARRVYAGNLDQRAVGVFGGRARVEDMAIVAGAEAPAMLFTDAADVEIERMSIDRSPGTFLGNSRVVLDDIDIGSLEVDTAAGSGIRVPFGGELTATRLRASATGRAAISVEQTGEVTLRDLTLTGPAQIGVDIGGDSQMTIARATLRSFDMQAIYAHDRSVFSAEDLTLEDQRGIGLWISESNRSTIVRAALADIASDAIGVTKANLSVVDLSIERAATGVQATNASFELDGFRISGAVSAGARLLASPRARLRRGAFSGNAHAIEADADFQPAHELDEVVFREEGPALSPP